MVNENVQQKINEQLFEKLELAYFCVDHSMNVKDVSDNLIDYGFEGICEGVNVEECVDFMVGMDSHTQLDLPMVASPSGIPIAVSLLPDETQLTVLISNASRQAEQRQQLQQKANENELLLEQQHSLMAQLEAASKELAHKNKQLEEASRLQTSFLSGVSHEFRTPLTSIIGYTNLVKRDLNQMSQDILPRVETAQDSDNYLQAVQRSSKHLLSLVENLLDHGKLDSNEIVIRPKPIDLDEVFEDVVMLLQPLSDTKSIQFLANLNLPKPANAVIDDSRLRQCLINLVGNAIKFTDLGSVSLTAELLDETLNIVIQDTGPGISKADLEKIRLPFWQGADTGKAGTGLGLTITERLIELMGGELSIESTLGEGTRVAFSISAPCPGDIYCNEAKESSLSESSLKILLAEDDSDIADLVVMMLMERGIEVDHVENGALALGALVAASYDLVLMDIHMPIMTGYEALAELQKIDGAPPVVIMSASAVEVDRMRAEELGCYAYLVKPVEIDDIVAIAEQVLENN